MRRLVVGCGYLGERVARFWRDAGDDVYATTRGDRADALSRAGLRPLKMDVTYGPVPRSTDLTAGRLIAGTPDAYLNLIHVEDAAAAVVAAAASGPVTARTYAVSDDHPPTRGEYAGWLATQLGVPPAGVRGRESAIFVFPGKSKCFNHFLDRASWLLLAPEAGFWELAGTIWGQSGDSLYSG